MSPLRNIFSVMKKASIVSGRATTIGMMERSPRNIKKLSFAPKTERSSKNLRVQRMQRSSRAFVLKKSNVLAEKILFILDFCGGIKMTCPKCNEKTKVIESRSDEDSTERRHECLVCGYRFTTIEIDKDLFERLVKRNDKRQRNP